MASFAKHDREHVQLGIIVVAYRYERPTPLNTPTEETYPYSLLLDETTRIVLYNRILAATQSADPITFLLYSYGGNAATSIAQKGGKKSLEKQHQSGRST